LSRRSSISRAASGVIAPQLARALDLCRAWRATLIIAKLDRLARNVEFTARLMNSGVEFVAAASPYEPAHDPHPCCYGGARTRDDQRPVLTRPKSQGVQRAQALARALNDEGCQRYRGQDGGKPTALCASYGSLKSLQHDQLSWCDGNSREARRSAGLLFGPRRARVRSRRD